MSGPASARESAAAASPGAVVMVASLGAAVMMSGIQGIAPAIPAIQEEFGLSTAELSLITSVYLLPSIFSAFAAGMLAGRIGMRPVFSGCLALFGLGSALLLAEHSYTTLMSVRLVQGAAFGAVMSLSVGVIGSVASAGPAAARAQSRRSIAIAMGEAVLPVAGGLLLALSWFAPFALGLLSLPLAAASWLILPPLEHTARRGADASGGGLLSAPAIVEVQALGALRFIFKFAVLTYYPVLAVNEVGMSPALVGTALGASAVLTAVAAAGTEKLAGRWSSAQLVRGCLVLIALSLVGMGATGQAAVATAALLLFGLQDGVFAVAHNVMVTEMAPPGARSTYIGLTGTVRNVGKVAAPLAFGAATLVVSVSASFLLLGAAGLLSIPVTRRVGRAQNASAAPRGGVAEG